MSNRQQHLLKNMLASRVPKKQKSLPRIKKEETREETSASTNRLMLLMNLT